jgi:hypothetical protein
MESCQELTYIIKDHSGRGEGQQILTAKDQQDIQSTNAQIVANSTMPKLGSTIAHKC